MLKRKEVVDWFKVNRHYKLDYESVQKTGFVDAECTELITIAPTKLTLLNPLFKVSYTLDSLRVEGQDIVNGLGSLRLYGSRVTK
jgi:hypothetical protein